MSEQGTYVHRRLLEVITERLRDEPVIALHGPRTVGKSTLLGGIATRAGSRPVDLDDAATRTAVAADPALFVSGPSPICIDE